MKTIDEKELIILLKNFISNINKETIGLKTSDYKALYNDTKTSAHFYKMFGGNSKFVNVPYISFLAHKQKTTKGIYPIIGYNRKQKTDNFFVGYGISETKQADINWNIDLKAKYQSNEKDSIFYKALLTINSEEDVEKQKEAIITSLNVIIEQFHNVFNNISVKDKEIQMQTNIPLNQILYGPPGTGKTYTTKNYIDKIIGNNPGLKTFDEAQKINEIIKDLYWYQVIALTMYSIDKNSKYKVKTIENHTIMKQYAPLKNSKNVYLTIIAQLQIHTDENSDTVNYSAKTPPAIFNKTNDSEWYLTNEGIKYVEENLSGYLEKLNSKTNTRKKEDFYKFITFHQSYSYEEFIEGIKPKINEDEENQKISYEFSKGVFKEICQQANSDPNNNYLLIIDEINRGNISKIFGELITLIEEDKRVTPNGEWSFENTKLEKQQLMTNLPYTQKPFGVPKNLYILGTMNTSDRSIASIDIALRRRFKFKEMMPDDKVVTEKVGDINLKEIFNNLNTKIKVLLDRDHQIGHSYFIDVKDEEHLKQIWFDSIIPLLNEYFYGDWEKLKLVIPGFIKSQDIPKELQDECGEKHYYEFRTLNDIQNDDFKALLEQKVFKENNAE